MRTVLVPPPAGGGGGTPLSVSDTFTDATGTAITAHTSDSGHTWLNHPSSAITAVITDPALAGASRLRRPNVSGTAVAYVDAAPTDADYRVGCELYVKALVSNSVGVIGRADATATTFYHFRADHTSGNWQLYKFVAGTATLLDSAAHSLTDETGFDIELHMSGTTIRGLVNTVEVCSAVDASISAAGFGGVRLTSASASHDATEYQIDDFYIEEL